MAVSSKMMSLVNLMTDKMFKLKPFIKDSIKLNAYNRMIDKWQTFRESLNRHNDESALPIVKDFNLQFNEFYNDVMKERGKEEVIKEIAQPHGKAGGAVTIAILLGGVAALFTIGKNLKR